MWWLAACTPPRAPDIVLISIDGMRADHAHFNGYPAHTTPSLDALAADGVNFRLAFSSSNESITSHAALLTGLEPPEVAWMDYDTFAVPESVTSLAEALRAQGYETGGFTAGGHVKAAFGFGQGFDTFEESADFGSFFDTVPMALKWLTGARRPRFLFVHGYDCHRPYAHASVFYHPFDRPYSGPMDQLVVRRNATEQIVDGVHYAGLSMPNLLHAGGVRMSDPAGYLEIRRRAALVPPWDRTSLNDADVAHMRAHYDSGVLAADTYVGMLIDVLRASPGWDNTLVLVVSDHGEELQEHGLSNHRATLTDATTHVPLLVAGGAVPPSMRGETVDRVVDTIDIATSLLDAAGAVPIAEGRGVSFRGCWDPAPDRGCTTRATAFQIGVLGQLSARTQTRRLVFEGYGATDSTVGVHLASDPITAASFHLYAADRDPAEQVDIKEQEQDVAEALRKELLTWYEDLRPSPARARISPEVTQASRCTCCTPPRRTLRLWGRRAL